MTTRKVEVVPIRIGNVSVTIEGNAPLVVNQFSQKSLIQMLGAQLGMPKLPKTPKDPVDLFLGACYVFPETSVEVHGEFNLEELGGFGPTNVSATGKFGLPAICLKHATVRSAKKVSGLAMTDLNQSIRVEGELLEIEAERAVMRCDFVRNETGVADIRFRPMFDPWRITAHLQFDRAILQTDQLLNLIRSAGFGNGLGEWRPQKKGGLWGTFDLVKAAEMEDTVWGSK